MLGREGQGIANGLEYRGQYRDEDNESADRPGSRLSRMDWSLPANRTPGLAASGEEPHRQGEPSDNRSGADIGCEAESRCGDAYGVHQSDDGKNIQTVPDAGPCDG